MEYYDTKIKIPEQASDKKLKKNVIPAAERTKLYEIGMEESRLRKEQGKNKKDDNTKRKDKEVLERLADEKTEIEFSVLSKKERNKLINAWRIARNNLFGVEKYGLSPEERIKGLAARRKLEDIASKIPKDVLKKVE